MSNNQTAKGQRDIRKEVAAADATVQMDGPRRGRDPKNARRHANQASLSAIGPCP